MGLCIFIGNKIKYSYWNRSYTLEIARLSICTAQRVLRQGMGRERQ